MEPYAGFEPQVGEIRALRTFRVGRGGVLYPLFSGTPWQDGENVARCRMVQLTGGALPPHPSPAADCTCGFYAYGSEQAAGEYPHAQHVLAVVACWGGVIAGTRGVRAERCRIEAVWLSGTVPAELVADVERQYPSTALYRNKAAMLAEHPPSLLDCYELPQPGHALLRRCLQVLTGCVVVASALPSSWWSGSGDARLVWAAAFVGFLLAALLMGRGRPRDMAVRRRRMLFLAVSLWVAAPFGGPAGTSLLRIPLVQLALLYLVHRYQLRRAASQFPAAIERA